MEETTEPLYTITGPNIHTYCEAYSSSPLTDYKHISANTLAQVGQVNMISRPFLGQYLKMMTRLINPKKILEIGTFTGFGALCMLEALSPDAEIHTLEKSEAHLAVALKHFEEANVSNRIHTYIGDAAESIEKLDHTWDLVFMDAAKRQYSHYFDLLLPKLKTGGVILADNVLWKGKVGHPNNDKLGLGLAAFNKKVFEDPRVENLILPMDDGVNFIIKKD